MDAPSCWLDEDGRHFWFQHECTPYDEVLLAELEPDVAEWYRERRRAPTMLPLGPAGWTVEQTDPLTVSPSIQCGTCGVHGFWRAGAWIPA